MKQTDKKKATTNVFQRMLEDKRARRECIRAGKDVETMAKARGIKFATPL